MANFIKYFQIDYPKYPSVEELDRMGKKGWELVCIETFENKWFDSMLEKHCIQKTYKATFKNELYMDVEQMRTAASEELNSGKELLYVAQKTAERIKKELKIKARKWLEENKDNYIIDIEGETIVDDAIIEDFLKALEK